MHAHPFIIMCDLIRLDMTNTRQAEAAATEKAAKREATAAAAAAHGAGVCMEDGGQAAAAKQQLRSKVVGKPQGGAAKSASRGGKGASAHR